MSLTDPSFNKLVERSRPPGTSPYKGYSSQEECLVSSTLETWDKEHDIQIQMQEERLTDSNTGKNLHLYCSSSPYPRYPTFPLPVLLLCACFLFLFNITCQGSMSVLYPNILLPLHGHFLGRDRICNWAHFAW